MRREAVCGETRESRYPGRVFPVARSLHFARRVNSRDSGKLLAIAATAASLACGPAPAEEQEIDAPEPEGTAIVTHAISVQEALTAGCSTSSVLGLSQQIVDQTNCNVPGALALLPDRPNLTKSATTFPFLQTAGRDALVAALDANPGMTLGVNSMFRSVAQQYLLYAWGQSSTCGIGLAAQPGNSNHESGLALDTSQYSQWRTALEARGFQWFGSSDAVHFDFRGPGTVDLKGQGIRAFQMLWNRNNPGDSIAEDGVYGPQTESRLEQSPAEGFAQGADCSGAGGTGGAGAGGTGAGGTGVGGAGGAGVGGVGGAGVGGAGGTGFGGVGASGGEPGVGGAGGAGVGGSAPQMGCSVAPDCDLCVGCMQRCVCETRDAVECIDLCGLGPDAGTAGSHQGTGGSSSATTGSRPASDDGGCACRATPHRSSMAPALLALLGLLAARRRHVAPRSTP